MPKHPPPHRHESLALVAALSLVVIWGINFSLQKFVFLSVSPGGFLWLRYLIMPALAVGLLVARFGRAWPPVTRDDTWRLVRLGLAGHFLHVGIVSYGIHWSTAFSSSLILACGPVFTLLILRWMGLERLRTAQVIGVSVALGGVVVFLSDKLLAANWSAAGGDLTLLLAASLFSYYTVAAKPLMARLGSVATMAYATLLGGVPVVLVATPAGLAVPWGQLGWAVWGAMLWMITVSAFLGWLLWGWVNAVRGVARTAPLMYLMPPVAGVVAWWFTAEPFTPVKLVGAAITLSGVALAQFAPHALAAAREAPAPVD